MRQVRNPIILRPVMGQNRRTAVHIASNRAQTGITAVAHQSLALAQAIITRCQLFAAYRGLSPVYRQERPLTLDQRSLVYQREVIAPRLKLTLLVAAATPAASPSPGTGHLAWQLLRPSTAAPASERLVYRLQQREQFERTAVIHTIHQLNARAQRLESVAAPGQPPAQAIPTRRPGAWPTADPPPPVPRVRAVPRVLHRPDARSAAAEQETATAVAAHHPAFPPPPTWSPATASSPSLPAAAIDVNHLTDQIMRNIDHRIIAYRERTGRM